MISHRPKITVKIRYYGHGELLSDKMGSPKRYIRPMVHPVFENELCNTWRNELTLTRLVSLIVNCQLLTFLGCG